MKCPRCNKKGGIKTADKMVYCEGCSCSWDEDDFFRECNHLKYKNRGIDISCYTCTHLQLCRFIIELRDTSFITNVNTFLNHLHKTVAEWCEYYEPSSEEQTKKGE